MKKGLFMAMFLILGWVNFSLVTASQPSPGGKNIMNPDLFDVDGEELYTYEAIGVKSNQNYVLSMLNFTGLDHVHIVVWDENFVYIDESNLEYDQCFNDSTHLVCSFVTSANTNGIYISISGMMIPLYISYYGFSEFQLEEGIIKTNYEPFQAAIEDTSDPVFQGSGTFVSSYQTFIDINSIIAQYVTAYDEIDGDLSNQIIITQDEYTGNESIVGIYPVELKVSDSSGNTAYFVLNIHIIDDLAPEIFGPDSIDFAVGSSLDIHALINQNFVFSDDYDGLITEYIIIEDLFTHNENVLGTKNVVIEISDSSGNPQQKTFTINIVDLVAPEIIGPTHLVLMLSNYPILNDILIQYSLSDNHTSAEEMVLLIAQSSLPELLDVTGQYTLILETEDASGNKAYLEINITLYDDIPPQLSGPVHYQISYVNLLSLNHLLSELIVSDNYLNLSVDDVIVKENSYHSNHSTPGLYTIIFAVNDENHEVNHQIMIEVIDDVPPVFSFDHRIIIDEGTMMSASALLNIVSTMQHITEFSPISIEILDMYPVNGPLAVGVYQIQVRLMNVQNEERIENIIIEVIESSTVDEVQDSNFLIPLLTIISGFSLAFFLYKRFRK